MESTRASLIWAIRDSQNAGAWIDFYRIYASLVQHFLRRFGLSDADADDVTQEVLLLAQRSLQTGAYDASRGGFRKWLFGIARRRALAALRARCRRTRAQWVPPEGGVDLVDQLEDERGEQAHRELWEQEWRYAVLDDAMRHVEGQVGDKAFRAFTLHAINQWPVDRVAEHLGIAAASVYVYKHRVLNAIKERVARLDSDER